LWKVAATVIGAVGGLLSLLFTIRSWRQARKNEAAAQKGFVRDEKPKAGAEVEVEMTVNPAAAGGVDSSVGAMPFS
jgi:Rieske Fe-S protein